MTTHTGKEGIVKVGANTVAEITGFSLDEAMSPIDDSGLNDTWDTHKAGPQNWNCSFEAWWDPSDTNGQQAMAIGNSVSLDLYGNGEASGDTHFTGTASITGISRSWARGSIVGATFTCQGSGALTEATVV